MKRPSARFDCATTRLLSSRCEQRDRESSPVKILPIISDTKLTNVLDDALAREIYLSQTCKRVFARCASGAGTKSAGRDYSTPAQLGLELFENTFMPADE
jgi:hypothetical protein